MSREISVIDGEFIDDIICLTCNVGYEVEVETVFVETVYDEEKVVYLLKVTCASCGIRKVYKFIWNGCYKHKLSFYKEGVTVSQRDNPENFENIMAMFNLDNPDVLRFVGVDYEEEGCFPVLKDLYFDVYKNEKVLLTAYFAEGLVV